MTRPELARSGDNPVGDNTPPGDPDERTNESTDTIGAIPDDNASGHSPAPDEDKPIEKFAARVGSDAASDADESSLRPKTRSFSHCVVDLFAPGASNSTT